MAAAPDPVPVLLAHTAAMRRLARALVYDEHLAEDVSQEATRVALTRSLPAGRPVWAWLAGVVRNTARNALRGERRRRKRETRAALPEQDVGPSPAEQVARVEVQRLAVEAVLRLEEPYRLVVIRRFFEGQSIDEIAARMETSRETVRTRLRRALLRLREDLDRAHRGGFGWRAALLPLVPQAPAPSAPSAASTSSIVGAVAMKKILTTIAALLILGLAWTTWRVTSLSAEVERLAQRPELVQVAGAPELAKTSAANAPPELATLSAPRASRDGVEQRLAALEKRIAELTAKSGEMEAAQREMAATMAGLFTEAVKSNETAAVSISRNVISAQAQFQQSAKVDVDSDRTGEYGGFVEMSAGATGRLAAGTVLTPPVLSGAFRALTTGGEVVRGGYVYRIFLPDARGAGVGEPQGGFTRGMVDPDLSETTWCLYAWPVAYGKTGTRTFCTNQGGDVTATDAPAYSGPGAGPAPDAAFMDRGPITGRIALGATGADGNVWRMTN